MQLASSVRLWALTGEVPMEMVGHTSIVYSVDSHISGLVVSGSEDCSTKIWKGCLLIYLYCNLLHFFWLFGHRYSLIIVDLLLNFIKGIVSESHC